eukprot:7382230-Alexandrium_andersonii.AAC.1
MAASRLEPDVICSSAAVSAREKPRSGCCAPWLSRTRARVSPVAACRERVWEGRPAAGCARAAALHGRVELAAGRHHLRRRRGPTRRRSVVAGRARAA